MIVTVVFGDHRQSTVIFGDGGVNFLRSSKSVARQEIDRCLEKILLL